MQATHPASTSKPASGSRSFSLLALWHLRRLVSYVTHGISVDSLCLLAVAMLCELPVLILRGLILLVLQALLSLLVSPAIVSPLIGVLLAALWLWAPLALVAPLGGGWWWRQIEGGRPPSERERLAYQDSVELLQAHSRRPLALPASWFVLDTPLPHAAVCGETLLLSRGMLESEHLPAVIAHELGHLSSTDGRLAAVLSRMVLLPPRVGAPNAERHPEQPPPTGVAVHFHGLLWPLALCLWKILKLLLALARGGIALRLTRPLWGVYWRQREYEADRFAAALGQADDLADFLELHALIHDQPIPFIWLTEHTHPPTELRIERLRAHADRQAREPLSDVGR